MSDYNEVLKVDQNTPEEWRPLQRCGLYEVSDNGRIRHAITQHIYKPSIRNGYLRIVLWTDSTHWFATDVHRLVAETFIGPIKAGHVVNHKDFNRQNNSASNLEVITQAENVAHQRAHNRLRGGALSGDTNGNSRLTWPQVRQIRALYRGPRSRPSSITLAKQFNVSDTLIRKIVSGQMWKEPACV